MPKTKKNENYRDSEYWEKRIANETWKTYNSLEEKNIDLLQMYEEASKQIKSELLELAEKAEINGSLSRTDQYRFQKLLGEQGYIYKECELLGDEIESKSKERMIKGGRAVYGNVMESLNVNDYSMPNKKVMEQMLRKPWQGSNFSKRLWKNMAKLESTLNTVIVSGITTGKTVTEMAVQLSNAMNRSFNEAHRLVRTETVNYLNQSAKLGYKDAGVQQVQWWAAKDERTCPTCGANHEKTYPIDKAPNLPCHPGCRCTWLPVIENAEDDIHNQISVENVNKSDTINVDKYLSFSNGTEVNEFFYYDGETRGLLARRNSLHTQWEKSLTESQHASISSYCADGYADINNYLRKYGDWKNINAEKVLVQTKDLDEAISSYMLKENIQVYRAIQSEAFKEYWGDMQALVGTEYSDPAFMSTSPFRGSSAVNKDCIMVMDIPAGKGRGAYINNLSGFKDEEYEFLLARDSKFTIQSVEELENEVIIKMEMIL